MYKALLTTFRTLTILPLPGKDTERFDLALYGFPVVGAVMGLFCLGWVQAAGLWMSPIGFQGASVLLLGLLCWLTGGLHWDGLADWADSKGAGADREKALRIMKDSSVGSFGAAALILFGLLWTQLAAVLINSPDWPRLFLVLLFSRSLQVELICSYPYARKESGMAGPFVEGATRWHRVVVLVLALACSVPFFGELAVSSLGVGFIATHLFGLIEKKRLGGITGDLVGASNQLNELVLLFFLILAPEPTRFGGWL